MTGYQEILTDPSYAGQIITFTFPHIGNVGVNTQDSETPQKTLAVRGAVFCAPITQPSNWRATQNLNVWLQNQGIVALSGIDTRALTCHIRKNGMCKAALSYEPQNPQNLVQKAQKTPDMEGLNLSDTVTSPTPFSWTKPLHKLLRPTKSSPKKIPTRNSPHNSPHVVVVDYGTKNNILRLLCHFGARVSVVPSHTSAQKILALKPQGILLSNGPGDPAATAKTALPVIRALLQTQLPLFGVCLGHQLLALALGAKTQKMPQGHHGANHPVKNLLNGSVDIVSMNHGFCVSNLPDGVQKTHISLFDGTNCGLASPKRSCLFGPIPPRSLSRPPRQPSSVYNLPGYDPLTPLKTID